MKVKEFVIGILKHVYSKANADDLEYSIASKDNYFGSYVVRTWKLNPNIEDVDWITVNTPCVGLSIGLLDVLRDFAKTYGFHLDSLGVHTNGRIWLGFRRMKDHEQETKKVRKRLQN